MKKSIGKACGVSLVLSSMLGMNAAGAAPPEEGFNDIPLQEIEISSDGADYYNKTLENEIYNYKFIRNIPQTYEKEGWETYWKVGKGLLNMDAENMNETDKNMLENAKKYRKNLEQTRPAEDSIWYLWGDEIPVAAEGTLEFTAESYDNEDFKPFLVPYLAEDQENAKGNMICIAGGGYSSRGNDGEGYPVAEAFQELGYNAYVLQRRVAPYSPQDSWLDLQRAVRVIRSKGEESGLGGQDMIASCGFSGGSGTILGTVAYLYGDVSPALYDKNYVPDEIDGLSADFDVVFPFYGPNYEYTEPYEGLVTENPNIPAMFIAKGADDDLVGDSIYTLLFSVKDKVMTEFHVFAGNGHGFGCGVAGTNAPEWIPMGDCFMTQVLEQKAKDKAGSQELDTEKYPLQQTYDYDFSFGTCEITCALNEEKNEFYIGFYAFDMDQVVTGTVNEDGIITVEYDASGFFGGEAQSIFSAADPDAWNK